MLVLKPENRFALEDYILIQALPEADMYFAFNVKTGDHFKLNNTAHWVLDRIGVGVRLDELTADFSEEYGLERQSALKDVNEVIIYAIDNHIVKEVL